jgi:hypothetical protein
MRGAVLWNFKKRKRDPDRPTFRQTIIGEVQVDSGALLIADAMHWEAPVKVKGVLPGRFPVQAQLISYPEGGQRVARIGLLFRPGTSDSRRTLGSIGVDSGRVIVVDARAFKRHWKVVGPERIGHIGTPDHRKIARLIEKKFKLKTNPVNFIASEVETPISEELEAEIIAYLQTFPAYADSTFMYFDVRTENTFERILDATLGRLWAEVVLDQDSGASLLAVHSGFGDGTYAAEGLYASGALIGVEMCFIGPAQDEILEAFPILRY